MKIRGNNDPKPLPKRKTDPRGNEPGKPLRDSTSTSGMDSDGMIWDGKGNRSTYNGKHVNHLGKYKANQTPEEIKKGAIGSRVADPKTGRMGTRRSVYTDQITNYRTDERKPEEDVAWDKEIKPEVKLKRAEDKADRKYIADTIAPKYRKVRKK